MGQAALKDPRLGRSLAADELFDLTLYRELLPVAGAQARTVLEELIPVETRHREFWQDFFGVRVERLDLGRRLKLRLLVGLCRLFGPAALHLVLEAIEIHGIRKYLTLWERARGTPLESAVREVLADEFGHEDQVVSRLAERKINPERVRSVFLGLNDGLVEILGAVSGFYAAFESPATILAASSTVAVAGAVSMAAGAFVAAGSEREVRDLEERRRRFLGGGEAGAGGDDPWLSAAIVGTAYFLGALVPVLPVLAGSRSALASVLAAGGLIVLISSVLAFLSGMDAKRRIGTNLVIIAAAVGISYAIGTFARAAWGV